MYIIGRRHNSKELFIVRTRDDNETISYVNEQSNSKAILATIGIYASDQPILGLIINNNKWAKYYT